MTENLYVDPAHRVPDDQWAKVVKDAEAINAAHLSRKTGGASSPAGPLINMLGSGKHSGVSGIPTQLLVLHSGECPLRGGYAQSLTDWANTPIDRGGPVASWHWFIDPIARVRMIEEAYAAWHASEANPISEGFEQAGYARYSRAEWMTPDGMLQMESLAYTMAQRAKVNSIPARWLTTAEVTRATSGDRSVKGFCLHRQIDPETRTDPGDGYPYELLMAKVKAYMGGTITTQSAPTQIKDWFDMATEDQLRKVIREENPWGYKNPALEKDDAYALLRATRTYVVKISAELAAVKSIMSQFAAKQGVAIDYAKIDAIVDKSIADAGLIKAGDVVSVDVNVTGK